MTNSISPIGPSNDLRTDNLNPVVPDEVDTNNRTPGAGGNRSLLFIIAKNRGRRGNPIGADY